MRLATGALVVAAALASACGGSSKAVGGEAGGTGGAGGATGGSGGSGARAGAGGTGGSGSNYYIGQIRQTARTKLDLLVMVDNSSSMGGKQRYLADALPALLLRLTEPPCVDADGNPVAAGPSCPSGTRPELAALTDIHVGVISSSLGDHGSNDLCSQSVASPEDTFNDLGQLLPSVRLGLQSWNDSGFLAWDTSDGTRGTAHQPPAFGSPLAGSPGTIADFSRVFVDHVEAAGERGCGHEAQLESWYRFLVDPEPVTTLMHDTQFSVRGALNQTVLAQRAAFLRPDSVLALVMLTDENDCSFIDEDGTQGWLAMYRGGTSGGWRMPRATSACVNPDDPSCRPCTAADTADPSCAMGTTLSSVEDNPNLRCYRMKERFGIDLKYPVSRYVEALTSSTIDPRSDGATAPNPLFSPGANGEPPRGPEDVVVLGIVGVPWQDVATDGTSGTPDSLAAGSRTLQLMTATELEASGRWDVILGDGSGPSDPFMVESVEPRPVGAPHPLLPGVAVTAPGGTLNAVNGTEQAVQANNPFDLQFACTFPLEVPVPCTEENAQGCDCNASDAPQQSPLCEYAAPMMDGVQVRAKAYPSVRELELLRELGSSAVVASVCPKNETVASGLSTTSDVDYGYMPAMSALVRRLKESFAARCLPRPLAPTEGRVPCTVIEVRAPEAAGCGPCDAASGRVALGSTRASLRAALDDHMRALALCGPELVPCESLCACEIPQFDGDDLTACQNDASDPGTAYGYCYVEESSGPGAPQLLAACPVTSKRILRFMGDDTPAQNALVFIACGL